LTRNGNKLTQRSLDTLIKLVRGAPDLSGRPYRSWEGCPGFSVTVHKSRVSYDYDYRMRGVDPATGRRWPNVTLHLGDGASHSLAEALDAYAEARKSVRRGIDARAERAASKQAQEMERLAELARTAARQSCTTRLTTYAEVLESRGLPVRYRDDEVRHVRKALESVNALDLTPSEITTPMVENMRIACPEKSRHARESALGRFLAWACKGTGHVPATMLFDRHERPKPPAPRRRVPGGGEIAAIWTAAGKLPHAVTADIVQFLIAVPARRGEAAGMMWCNLDFVQKIWHQPITKNGDPHDYPLNPRSLAILARRREATGGHRDDYVFPGPRYAKPFVGWSNLVEAIIARLPTDICIDDFRLHDMRRGFVTHLAEQGFEETLLDLTINHRAARSRSGVRGVYQRAVRWPERVAALAAWNDNLDRWLGVNVTWLCPVVP
jgi:integrase